MARGGLARTLAENCKRGTLSVGDVETNISPKADGTCYGSIAPRLCFVENQYAKKQLAYGTIYMWVTARTRWKHRVGPSSVELTLAYT
jgi:hypothetical protein